MFRDVSENNKLTTEIRIFIAFISNSLFRTDISLSCVYTCSLSKWSEQSLNTISSCTYLKKKLFVSYCYFTSIIPLNAFNLKVTLCYVCNDVLPQRETFDICCLSRSLTKIASFQYMPSEYLHSFGWFNIFVAFSFYYHC